MNLADLVSYITTKTQLVTTDDIAACSMFVSKRYELIYNSYLWRDSLVMVKVPYDPVNNPDNKEGIVLLPEVINRVVALRTNCQSVRVNGLEYYYRIDWDAFNAGVNNLYGAATEFSILSPIWFVWRGAEGLVLTYDNANADTKPVMVTWRDETGRQYVQTVTNLATLPSTMPFQIKVTGAGSSEANGTYQFDGTQFNQLNPAAPPPILNIIQDANFENWLIVEITGTSQTTLYSTPGKFVSQNPWVTVNGDGPAPVVTLVENARLEIESLFKPVTLGAIELDPLQPNDVAGGVLQPADLNSPSYQRIRLFSIPQNTTTLNVLGKRPFVPLTFDQQIPQLRNIDNVLIAFAGADLLKRARQYAKAATEMQEGVALLKELALLEVIQAANNQRFVPDSGYGSEYFSASNGGGFWGL